ncbi:MAG TPA: protein kinase, partial [Rhizobacter sp.]|nr:protein kinase [Rhizobacter sp.]
MLSYPTKNAPKMLGRFELRTQLGEGAQATVWLAFDPRLEREVALKLMHAGANEEAVGQWLQEARLVSRLHHPHIVPVFEADVHAQQPYLVFEYVPGRTLTEHLRARGALPAREAVELILGVLDALHMAHQAGVIHRDLKPSNILVDGSGRARVMDFGIAVRMQDTASHEQVIGTPGYMSPEATHGHKPAPTMDIFSVGLVLAEMLSGQKLIVEKDPYRAIYRVAHEDMKFPAGTPAEVDDPLRAIVLRSMARDPSQRYADVTLLRDALQTWLAPVDNVKPMSQSNGTLEFLLRRMRHKTDFPAMSDSVARIQRVANCENETLAGLSNEILKDVALTNKLLRLVNTARYSQVGGGSINTVSRAVALIGFAGIRNMALSLVLLEHMDDKAHANLLKEEFLRSLMAASLADELCGEARDGEEAFIGAMFQNLGRLLTEFYFPEEATKVRSLAQAAHKSGTPRRGTTTADHAASINVLGLSFEDLGVGVAKAWGLPEGLQRCMRRPTGEPPTRPTDKAERLRWAAVAANDLTDALLEPEPLGAAAVKGATERYARALGLAPSEMQDAVVHARQKLTELAQAMNLQAPVNSPIRKLIEKVDKAAAPPEPQDNLSAHELQATMPINVA